MSDEFPVASDGLQIKGFVLAGGKSSRMGSDKALLAFRGRPMLELALETLRAVCGETAISGNREDLAAWGPVVPELRIAAGPAAGIEAALANARQPWVLMLPVDLPMVSAELLRLWIAAVLRTDNDNARASYMGCGGEWHPALCLVHRECLPVFRAALDAGNRKLTRIFQGLGEQLLVVDASTLVPDAERCFTNVNTPEELVEAETVKEPAG